jgi:hypothetical protein
VRVFLQRQVTIVLKGHQLMRKFPIGEGNVRSLPPSASPPSMLRSQQQQQQQHLGHGLSTLDYEGEVHPNPDLMAGQFGMSRLQIRVRQFVAIIWRRTDLLCGAGLCHDESCPSKSTYIAAQLSSTFTSYPPRHRPLHGQCRSLNSHVGHVT